jgi:heme/copper-type cytochrome/quinol oxidase subunit 2
METMKTTNLSKKTISILLVVVLFSCQSAFAQSPNAIAEDDSLIHNLTFMISVFLFIVGFTALIVLKMRDDNKKQEGNHNQPLNTRHRNHYGRKHQYNH